jgi:hypothetical protein
MLGVQEAIAVASWTPPGQRLRIRLRGGCEGGRNAVRSAGSIWHGRLDVLLWRALVVDNVWGDSVYLAGPLFVPDVGRTSRLPPTAITGGTTDALDNCELQQSLLDAPAALDFPPCDDSTTYSLPSFTLIIPAHFRSCTFICTAGGDGC